MGNIVHANCLRELIIKRQESPKTIVYVYTLNTLKQEKKDPKTEGVLWPFCIRKDCTEIFKNSSNLVNLGNNNLCHESCFAHLNKNNPQMRAALPGACNRVIFSYNVKNFFESHEDLKPAAQVWPGCVRCEQPVCSSNKGVLLNTDQERNCLCSSIQFCHENCTTEQKTMRIDFTCKFCTERIEGNLVQVDVKNIEDIASNFDSSKACSYLRIPGWRSPSQYKPHASPSHSLQSPESSPLKSRRKLILENEPVEPPSPQKSDASLDSSDLRALREKTLSFQSRSSYLDVLATTPPYAPSIPPCEAVTLQEEKKEIPQPAIVYNIQVNNFNDPRLMAALAFQQQKINNLKREQFTQKFKQIDQAQKRITERQGTIETEEKRYALHALSLDKQIKTLGAKIQALIQGVKKQLQQSPYDLNFEKIIRIQTEIFTEQDRIYQEQIKRSQKGNQQGFHKNSF